MKKEKLYIIFTDLDGTFTPTSPKTLQKFVDTVKKIQEKENVIVKFCPVSGRPSSYVLCMMDLVNGTFKEEGIENISEFGSSEQGALIVHADSPYTQTFLGKYKNIKEEVTEVFNSSDLKNFFEDEPANRCIGAFILKSKFEKSIPTEQQITYYNKLYDLFKQKLGDRANIVNSGGCVEVAPLDVGKDKAIKWIIDQYNKSYEIVGMAYSGDSDNDKAAVNYMSRLAEIPGTVSNIFLPTNANQNIQSSAVEQWKNKFKNISCKGRIIKSNKLRYEGVLELIESALKNKTLVGKGIEKWETKDDFDIEKSMKNHEMSTKLSKWASKDDSYLKSQIGISNIL